MKAAAPYRSVRLGSTDVTVRRESNGNIYVLSRQSLGPYPEKMTERLDHWADHAPNRVFMAQQALDGSWRMLTYGDARTLARNIGQALVNRAACRSNSHSRSCRAMTWSTLCWVWQPCIRQCPTRRFPRPTLSSHRISGNCATSWTF